MEKLLTYFVSAAEALLKSRERIILALDGRCASGKTTVAGLLQRETGCTVIHMDDFFLRPEQRTPQRLAQPGGNVDRERFLEQVLLPLKRGLPFSYRPYDCRRQTLGREISIAPAAITVVEGSYCCHPELWEHYDLRVFLTVDPAVQLARIVERNGPDQAAVFREQWIPMEESYFSAFDISRRCHRCFDMTGEKTISIPTALI